METNEEEKKEEIENDTLSFSELTSLVKQYLEVKEHMRLIDYEILRLSFENSSDIKLLSKLKNFTLPPVKEVYFKSIKDNSENVAYFLAHCLPPKYLDTLTLTSGDYSSSIKPEIDKYIESLSRINQVNEVVVKSKECSTPIQLITPTKSIYLISFRISKEKFQTIINMSAHLTEGLSIRTCNIQTKWLKFDSKIKFTVPWISFSF